MPTTYIILLLAILSGCAAAPPVITLERTEFGVLVPCVEGETKCREPSEEDQKKNIRAILDLYECKP